MIEFEIAVKRKKKLAVLFSFEPFSGTLIVMLACVKYNEIIHKINPISLSYLVNMHRNLINVVFLLVR